MIYLTGDCHGEFGRFSKKQRMRLPFELTPDDFVVICGDMGLLWAEDKEFAYYQKWLSALPFTILWIQGNHENYDLIAKYPVCMWHGGKVRHIVPDKIILLERGQVFTIEEKRFFTFGGASTHDIQGGILDKTSPTYEKDRRRANKRGLPYRVRGVSWWAQELPSEQEMQEGRENLRKAGSQVDYVITHCLAGKMQDRLEAILGAGEGSAHGYRVHEKDILTAYFDELETMLQYKHWFCGHYHVNLTLDERHTVLYQQLIALEHPSGQGTHFCTLP